MPSFFRYIIPSQYYPAEHNRYVLYVNYGCSWSHRAIIVHELKGLQGIVQLVEVDAQDPTHGWYFGGRTGPSQDPLYGMRWVKELYLKADPGYTGRITLPVLWDRKTGTLVNNESSDIIRMFFSGFDDFLPAGSREASKGATAFIPHHLRTEIDTLNSWVYNTVNNGVYKVGFSTSQEAYNDHVTRLFHSLDRLEYHLAQPGHYPFLFGYWVTEADIRLFTTLIRFDVVYNTLMRCNLKSIRTHYPRLHTWLRALYWNNGVETGFGVFRRTTHFDRVSDSMPDFIP